MKERYLRLRIPENEEELSNLVEGEAVFFSEWDWRKSEYSDPCIVVYDGRTNAKKEMLIFTQFLSLPFSPESEPVINTYVVPKKELFVKEGVVVFNLATSLKITITDNELLFYKSKNDLIRKLIEDRI